MNDCVRELSDAVRAWVGSLDQGGAGTAVTELVLRELGDEEPALRLQLRELVSDELRYVLFTDASARAGGAPVTRDRYGARPDAGEELRHAAARLDHLTSVSELSPKGVERGWPTDAASALHEASRISELLAGLIPSAIEPVLDNLDRGSVVPSSTAGATCRASQAGCQRGTAEAIAAMLGETAVQLQELSRQIANLQHTFGSVKEDGQKDGPTLDAEVVLEWRMPGMANESRFHVRVFRPSGKPPVVVIGDMSDNHSQSITNVVGEVAAVVTEYLLGGGPLNSYQWVQVDPPGRFRAAEADLGVIQAVSFEDRHRRPRRRPQTHEELEQLAGGAVRRWHSSDYNVAVMTNRGIPILHPGTDRR